MSVTYLPFSSASHILVNSIEQKQRHGLTILTVFSIYINLRFVIGRYVTLRDFVVIRSQEIAMVS